MDIHILFFTIPDADVALRVYNACRPSKCRSQVSNTITALYLKEFAKYYTTKRTVFHYDHTNSD